MITTTGAEGNSHDRIVSRLKSLKIQLANPFGAGIYLKVPEGTDADWFTMTLENVIQSPYFSWRNERQTDVATWLANVIETGAPWADFESDKMLLLNLRASRTRMI